MEKETFNKPKETRREFAIDIAKGIGLLAVIVGHIDLGKPGAILYIFHLPLFFLIAGYCFKFEESFECFFKKKVKGYLVPYIGCSAILALYDGLKGIVKGSGISQGIHTLFLLMMQRRYSTLWFLATLFLGILIFWLIVKLCKDNMKIFVCCYIVGVLFVFYDTFVGIPLPWNLDTAFIIQIFLATGFVIKHNQVMERLKENMGINVVLLVTLSAFCSLLNYLICHQTYQMFASRYGIFPLTILAALTCSLAVILLSYKFKKLKPLEWLGKNTMVFFAFHQGIAIDIFIHIEKYIGIPLSSLNICLVIGIKMVELLFCLGVCFILHITLIKCKMGCILGK